ncbi:MAG: hypothetical protein JSV84_05535 [Gemmatimonadota bacterium]|nr:MAG: hypothetical protein JSV84_05535 [Gemmatimonadota bacterium]
MKSVIVALFCFLVNATIVLSQVAVISHKSVPEDSMTKSVLLDLYTGDIQSWSNGEPVIVIDLKPRGDVKTAFYDFIGKKSSRIKSIWLKKKLSGEWDTPESLETEDDVVKKVASTAGAIGFVSQSSVTTDVKVLLLIQQGKN